MGLILLQNKQKNKALISHIFNEKNILSERFILLKSLALHVNKF